MLLELAIGDAYGAGFEYTNRDFIKQHNTLERYVHHPRHKAIKPGMYTDDSQMTIAVVEAMLSGEDWTPLLLANKFVECFKRDQRTGYASGFYGFLLKVKDGQDFLANIRPTSDKSGGAMRAAPLGVYADISEVLEKCQVQAVVTHNTPAGIHAAQAAALMAHYFLHQRGPLADLPAFIEAHVPGDWSTPWTGKVKSKGWMSVRAAITAVVRHNNLSDLLRYCVNYGGDVDTVATIALAAASCSEEYVNDLPQVLVDGLENGAYGRDYLQQLEQQLW